MKTKIKWLLGVLAVIVIATVLYMVFLNFLNPRYFSYTKCEGGDGGFPDYIKEAKWTDGFLKIKSVVKANCGSSLKGSYNLDQDSIILNVKRGSDIRRMKLCDCDYKNEFSLKGIPQKDYRVVLRVDGKERDQLMLKANGDISDACDQDRSYACYKDSLLAIQFPASKDTTENDQGELHKEIIFDSEENKKIAEADPDFLRLFKKFEGEYFDKTFDYEIYLISYNQSDKNLELDYFRDRQTYQETETQIPNSVLASHVDSFEEGIRQYVNGKKVLESPNSLEARLKERLSYEVVRTTPNEYGFDFIYNGENVEYYAHGDGSGRISFSDRPENINFNFLTGFPTAEVVDDSKLTQLTEMANKIYQILISNSNIIIENTSYVYIQPTQMKARFQAEIIPTREQSIKNMTIHNLVIPVQAPIKQRYELNIESGEFTVLTGEEKVDEY